MLSCLKKGCGDEVTRLTHNIDKARGDIMFRIKRDAVLFSICCFVGLGLAQEVYDGYVLYDQGRNVYLMNNDKEVVYSWENLGENPYGVYMNENGNLIRPCKTDQPGIEYAVSFGSVQEIDKNGNPLWTFNYKSDSLVGHHDIALMPNGNFLLIAYEEKTVEEARSVGFDTDSDILLEHIVEVQPPENGQGEPQIVWKWHIWDHLTTGNEPELFDAGIETNGGWGGGWGGGGMFGTNEWMHMNGIDYNPELDQIMFSSRYFSELYIIDHSTSTEEAAGHSGGNSGKGGDILFRWGKPANYGAQGTQWVHGALHCPMWVPQGYPGEGNITVFVNTTQSDNSAVYEIAPQKQGQYNYVQDGSVAPIWSFEDLSSQVMSGAHRLPNGNTFICEASSGRLLEVNPSGDVVWEHTPSNTFNMQPRAMKYGSDYPGIQNLLGTTVRKDSPNELQNRIAQIDIALKGRNLEVQNVAGRGKIDVVDIAGKEVLSRNIAQGLSTIPVSHLTAGMYVVSVRNREGVTKKVVHRICK